MAQDKSKLIMSFLDSNGETGTVVVPGEDINDTTNTVDILDGFFDAAKAAILAVSDGAQSKESRVYSEGILSATRPADAGVQRAIKWMVSGHVSTTLKPVSLEIPCAKTSGFGEGDLITPQEPGANQYLDLGQGVGLALAEALEDVWKGGDDYTLPVVVDRIELVTRRGS